MLSGDKKHSCILSPFIWYEALGKRRRGLRRERWREEEQEVGGTLREKETQRGDERTDAE